MHKYKSLFEDITNYEDDFRKIKTLDDGSWTYLEERPGIAVLPWKKDLNSEVYYLLLRKESNPISASNFIETIITGRQDDNETFIKTCIRELYEEGGLTISEKELIYCGSYKFSKAYKTEDKIYLADCSNSIQQTPTTDGTKHEKMSKNYWIEESKFLEIAKNSTDSAIKILSFHYIMEKNNGKI